MPEILENVYKTETNLVNKAFLDARNPTTSHMLPRVGFNQKILNQNNTGYPQDNVMRNTYGSSNGGGGSASMFVSQLSGQPINKESFHGNMVPFIKNKNQQSLQDNAYSNTLGRHTGNDETYRTKKQETKSFFDVTPNNSYIYGSPSFTESVDMDRYVPSQKRQNEKPFENIRVGPGLAAGYTSSPSGGLNQANTRDYILPKSIDELRVLTNPKVSYDGRVIAGFKSSQRGLQAKPVKHRPERYYNTNPERGNLSSVIKASKLREKFYIKPTQKQQHKEYYGNTGQSQITKPRRSELFRRSTKNNYVNPQPRNAYRESAWGIKEMMEDDTIADYGKNAIENKPNERDTTQENVYTNNISITVKKLITPVTDFFRRTRKENVTGNARPEGNMNARMPAKQTVYDPSQITRTTIKEQMIDNSYLGQLSGAIQGTVYDPNDVARTTIKEQNIHNNTPYINMNPQQPCSLRIYDPEDISRTTMKEVTLDNEHIGFVGNQQSLKGGYTSTSVDMKNTGRQFLTDWYYQGVADCEVGTGTGRGYLASSYDAKNTNRQFLNDWDWEGPIKGNNNPTNYDSMYNARLNHNRETISQGREPTYETVKLNAGGDFVNIKHKKLETDKINKRNPNETYISPAPPERCSQGTVRMKPNLPENTHMLRNNPDILRPFKENPYTQSLQSAY